MAGSQGQFLRTERDRPMVCLKGYLYTKHCTNDQLVIWRCKRRSCRLRIEATPAGLVIDVRSLHDHEASEARVELAQVRERMKEMAQSSAFAGTGHISYASIGSCSNKVQTILPKESTIKHEIKNHKALPPIELVGVNGIGQIHSSFPLFVRSMPV